MTVRTMAALLATCALVSSSPAAQGVAPQPSASAFVDPQNGLSLEDAVSRALAREPSIVAVRSTVDVARAMELQAGQRRNPSLSMELRGEPAGTDSQVMVGLAWPLDLFRRDGRTAVAEHEIKAAELSVADRERLLAADVRARFGDVLVAVREIVLLDELTDAVRRQYDLLSARVEEGASPPLERDLLDVELRRLDADRMLQVGRAEAAMFALKRILGVSPGETVRVRETLEAVVQRESALIIPLTPGAAERRTDVREAEARIGLAEAKVDRAERDGRFDVSLFGSYMRMDAGFPQLGLSPLGTPERVHGVFHYVAAGAMVTIPLVNQNQGEVAAAQAERAGAVAAREAARLSAQTEIAAARALDQRTHEAAHLYGDTARTLARQNLNVVGQSYALGRSTIFEVLAEQKRYLELERAYTETLRAAYEARTMLNRALGEMP